MKNIILLILIFGILASAIVYLIYTVRQIWPTALNAWRELSSFERASLLTGIYLYASIPIIESHQQAVEYLGKISIPIFDALANALFVLGALAFLQRLHEQRRSQQSENSQSPGR